MFSRTETANVRMVIGALDNHTLAFFLLTLNYSVYFSTLDISGEVEFGYDAPGLAYFLYQKKEHVGRSASVHHHRRSYSVKIASSYPKHLVTDL